MHLPTEYEMSWKLADNRWRVAQIDTRARSATPPTRLHTWRGVIAGALVALATRIAPPGSATSIA